MITANDYYPGGMVMPGRKYSIANTNYRYGFNGKANDNEVKGEGNQRDYGMRIYDPRLGRFLSVDPVFADYPELTPYQFASNSPSSLIDIDGKEGGWELSSPSLQLKRLIALNTPLNLKKTNNPATSSPTPRITPVHSEGPLLAIQQVQMNVHRFDRKAKENENIQKQKQPDYIKEFIETGSEVTEHTERALDLMGKEKISKAFGRVGNIFSGASFTYNIVKHDYDGAARDVGEFIIGKSPFASYYYSGKLLKSILLSDYNLTNAWVDAEQRKDIAINNMRYFSDRNSDHFNQELADKYQKDADENRVIQEGLEKAIKTKKAEEK